MVGYSNIEARSCNNSCSGKAISITYPERALVALGVRYAMCMRPIVICGLPRLYNIFPLYFTNDTI